MQDRNMPLSAARLEELAAVLFLIGLCTLFVRFGCQSLAILRLKSRHPAAWVELECPTPFKRAKSGRFFRAAAGTGNSPTEPWTPT
jgi:hypothetical protein